MNRHRQYQTGAIPAVALTASAILSLLALTGIYMLPITTTTTEADMLITPTSKTVTIGESFTVAIEVQADVPVNVFTGLIWFNNEALEVLQIDYNTGVADLWTQDPWYKNGDGSIGFAGGTTKPGGFIGTDTLMTITFQAINAGEGNIMIENARILEHDGQGTDATIASLEPTYFTIATTTGTSRTIVEKTVPPVDIMIMTEERTTDLNTDGKTDIADLSIFMLHLTAGNRVADFNGDGAVTIADLSILLQTE